MELPVFYNDEVLGELQIETQGLYRVYWARIKNPGFLPRLYIEGEGQRAALGILKPEGNKAVLHKSLSRMEYRKLPQKIHRAFILDYRLSPDAVPGAHKMEKSRPSLWQELPDGCLCGEINGRRYIAFPSSIDRKIRGIRRIKYKKQEYIAFRY